MCAPAFSCLIDLSPDTDNLIVAYVFAYETD
jgi:hypothetical protein